MTIQADPDTGPLRVLAERGLSTREIARELSRAGQPVSQSTVSRRLRQIREAEAAARAAGTWKVAMYCTLTLCAVIIAAAFATIAWAH